MGGKVAPAAALSLGCLEGTAVLLNLELDQFTVFVAR
jgi:hypothetical protein